MSTAHRVLLIIHISMGMVALASGAAAMIVRKGSPRHRRSGNVFFGSMLIMSALGTAMAAFIVPNRGSVMGGLLTFYLALTGWTTVRRKPGETGALEVGAAILGLATATAAAIWANAAVNSPTGRLDSFPPSLYFTFGGVALVGTLLDARMIARGGLRGAARTTRHLWRMCFAMFMATSSFFLGQAKLFPEGVRESGALRIPVLLVVGAFFYWLVRIRVWPSLRRLRGPHLSDSI
ncbi:MAG: hypothetical protein ABIP93_19145 [Gemmatimonadaceae bacterium]